MSRRGGSCDGSEEAEAEDDARVARPCCYRCRWGGAVCLLSTMADVRTARQVLAGDKDAEVRRAITQG